MEVEEAQEEALAEEAPTRRQPARRRSAAGAAPRPSQVRRPGSYGSNADASP